MNSLIYTILPQNTSDANSDHAYSALRPHFPDWEDVHRTPLRPLISATRFGELSNSKAVRIKPLLKEIWRGHRHFDLSIVRDLSDESVATAALQASKRS